MKITIIKMFQLRDQMWDKVAIVKYKIEEGWNYEII